MKLQLVGYPNVMIRGYFFASISNNDKGIVNISSIEEELERVLVNH
jgi:hypothetical protein